MHFASELHKLESNHHTAISTASTAPNVHDYAQKSMIQQQLTKEDGSTMDSARNTPPPNHIKSPHHATKPATSQFVGQGVGHQYEQDAGLHHGCFNSESHCSANKGNTKLKPSTTSAITQQLNISQCNWLKKYKQDSSPPTALKTTTKKTRNTHCKKRNLIQCNIQQYMHNYNASTRQVWPIHQVLVFQMGGLCLNVPVAMYFVSAFYQGATRQVPSHQAIQGVHDGRSIFCIFLISSDPHHWV